MISNELRQYLHKVCTALNEEGVDYLLIGGTAVAFHGYSRISASIDIPGRPEITHDIDFWYNPTPANFHNITKALTKLGIDTSSLDSYVFNKHNTFLKIPFDTFKVDFLCQLDGLVSYHRSKQNAKTVTLDGVNISIISLEDLILNKQAINRSIDQIDIQELLQKKSKGFNQ